MKKILLTLILTFTFSNTVQALNIKSLAKKYGFNEQNISVSLIDLDSKKEVVAINENSLFIPASVNKVITVDYALSHLNPNGRFKTYLKSNGRVQGNRLIGDLYLVGGGDPSLTHEGLMQLIQGLKMKGIKEIDGNFYYDDTYFRSLPFISDIGYLDQTYNPGISGLNAQFNRLTLWKVKSERKVLPDLDYFGIDNSRGNFSYGQDFKFKIEGNNHIWYFDRSKKYSTKESVPIKNPGKFAANYFKKLASMQGIKISSPELRQSPRNLKVLAVNESYTFYEIAKLTLEYSNNLFAEALLLEAYKRKNAKTPASLGQAAQDMTSWLQQAYPRTNFTGAILKNGSGLSPYSFISSKQLSTHLQALELKSYDGKSIWPLMIVAGESGSIASRLSGPDNHLKTWGKTGSLDFAHTLTGYIMAKSGKRYAFSIMTYDAKKRKDSNFPGSKAYVRVQKSSGIWARNARGFIDDLISQITQKY